METVEESTYLQVNIDSAEFAKPFKYFITCQPVINENAIEKRRTNISDTTQKPQFKSNRFNYQLPKSQLPQDMLIIFQAFVVIKQDGNLQDKGSAKILGECKVDLSRYTQELQQDGSVSIQQKFTRSKDQKQVIVGKFTLTVRLITGSLVSELDQEKDSRTVTPSILEEQKSKKASKAPSVKSQYDNSFLKGAPSDQSYVQNSQDFQQKMFAAQNQQDISMMSHISRQPLDVKHDFLKSIQKSEQNSYLNEISRRKLEDQPSQQDLLNSRIQKKNKPLKQQVPNESLLQEILDQGLDFA